jgi:two-component system, OmpR family, sensor histidine kinase PhoQ
VRSVSQRLLLSVTLLLLFFFAVMSVGLDASVRRLAEDSLRETLDAQMITLIASAEPDSSGRIAPRLSVSDVDERLNTLGSGLYATVSAGAGEPYWRSPSATGSVERLGPSQKPGDEDFRYLTDARGARLAALSLGFDWEDEGDLTFSVATDMAPYDLSMRRFRGGLLTGVAVGTVLLLLALAVLLRWALAPLRRLEAQIRSVERGERDQLDDRWPKELAGVVANVNTLLTAERTRIARYRDTLGNLAHSLKTPLAVLRASFSQDAAGAAQVNAQVDRMTAIVEHQLRRAATSGGASVGRHAVELLPIAQELRSTLLKVHGKKDFSLEVAIAPQLLFVGDRDDLTEALGNLMDNAAKWCRSRIRVSASFHDAAGAARKLAIVVEDDGPGVPAQDRERVLERGARADEHTPGHGLGLAMVLDMVDMYGGRLEIAESRLGGARVELRLPGRMR